MSRNPVLPEKMPELIVTPRKGRVSRNKREIEEQLIKNVTPRKGRVSRNEKLGYTYEKCMASRLARGV